MERRARRAKLAALPILMLAAHPAAARWTVTPDITLRETYTDNVFVGSATRESDLVTQITPGIRIDGRSRRDAPRQ